VTSDRTQFVRSHTQITAPSLVPEVRLHLATEVTPLWTATQDFLDSHMLPPPYWAFAWPGGQALARYVLDHPHVVRGRHVLSFAAGGGIDAIAARLAGASAVEANEIDAFACAAIRLNAALNDVALDVLNEDVIGRVEDRWEVVIAGDVCYEKPMAERATAWLAGLVARGVTVITADPGRSYLPSVGLEKVGEYDVPTSLDLEDRTLRTTAVYRWI
jgi:predicted nicotinamide N-methyase